MGIRATPLVQWGDVWGADEVTYIKDSVSQKQLWWEQQLLGVAAKGKSRQRAFISGVLVAIVDHIVKVRSEQWVPPSDIIVARVGHIVKGKSERWMLPGGL